MNPEIDALARLDAADREIARLEAEFKDRELLHRKLEEAKKAAELVLVKAEAAVVANKKAQSDRNVSLHRWADRRRSAVRALETAAGDPSAAERQLSACDAAIADDENAVLDLMLEMDARVAAVAESNKGVHDATEAVGKARDGFPAFRNVNLTAKAKAVSQRTSARSDLPRELLSKYDLLSTKGFSATTIVSDACRACNASVAPQMQADIRSGRLETCRGCGRFLLSS